MRILCAGDDFMKPELFVEALRKELGEGHEYITDHSAWPREPYGESDEIQEWVGDEKHLTDLLRGTHVLVTHVAPVTAAMIEAAHDLKIIGSCRGGPVNINTAAATKHGIPVAYVPGRNARAVAEFTVGLLIAGQRHIVESDAALRRGRWSGHLYAYELAGTELLDRTIGLIGFGQIGMRVAGLLRSFGMHILTYDPYVDPHVALELGVEMVGSLEHLLSVSDIVSVHARLSSETKGMINHDTLAKMKQGAYLINTARGKIVKMDALIDALTSGHLSGAALDVYEEEPPPADSPLLRLSQVTITSHLAGSSKEVAQRAARWTAAEVGRFTRGEPLHACANPEAERGR